MILALLVCILDAMGKLVSQGVVNSTMSITEYMLRRRCRVLHRVWSTSEIMAMLIEMPACSRSNLCQ